MKTSPGELLVLPSARARLGAPGRFRMSAKCLTGAAQYRSTWPGKVTLLVDLADTDSTDMDIVEFDPRELPTGFEVRPAGRAELAHRLAASAVVLAHLSRREAALASLCAGGAVPLAYVAEYSLETEHQIIDSETRNPLLRWRRKLWANRTERMRIAALRQATGLQCSGTPTHESYAPHCQRTLLFFDNRVPIASVVRVEDLEDRLQTLATPGPLRLLYGGRLIAMKGVLDLPLVARALLDRGVDFTLTVHGSGPLAARLLDLAARLGLGERFRLRGPLDFESGWLPTLRREVDLFVCCHPQGDPSSTYPEVMSCGVPIVGYDNRALRGIVTHSGAGFTTPLGNVQALADRIAQLALDRATIATAARQSRRFAGDHAFENTYARRVAHLLECADAESPRPR